MTREKTYRRVGRLHGHVLGVFQGPRARQGPAPGPRRAQNRVILPQNRVILAQSGRFRPLFHHFSTIFGSEMRIFRANPYLNLMPLDPKMEPSSLGEGRHLPALAQRRRFQHLRDLYGTHGLGLTGTPEIGGLDGASDRKSPKWQK